MWQDKKLWGSVTVGAKGQIVIPAEARDDLGIKEGDKLLVVSCPGRGRGFMVLKADVINKIINQMQDLQDQANQDS